MKSVVVEASTVAKAIEIAWLKAEKPEEFFVRVLQEHSAGFLGFGAQKAKIVLFFKNTHKSDSLFPVVLKQKEYANFFDNNNLKVPTELNVVNNELNKNISLGGGQQKKKQHNNNLQKTKQNNQVDTNHILNKTVAIDKTVHKNVEKQNQQVKQINIQSAKPQHQKKQQEKVFNVQPKMQVSLQAHEQEASREVISVKTIEKKDDVVKNIAKVLKKVQTQKIVANVSRPVREINADVKPQHVYKTSTDRTRPVTVKFENYADYAQAAIDKLSEKNENVTDKIKPVISNVVNQHVAAEVVVLQSERATTLVEKTPRPVLKMKRRPLTTENPGVSGITRSSSSTKSTKDVEHKLSDWIAAVDALEDENNKK